MFEYLLYYPVTAILWFWHKVFGLGFGEANVVSWILGLIFLTFTIRAILFKPFVGQVRSMKKMQDFAPEIKKIQKRYANDKQRQAQAMQKLQREHGVNPLGGCLPILLQVPVFIGLNHTLRSFPIHEEKGWGNYTFNLTEVKQYLGANLFGSNLGEAVYNTGFTAATDGQAYHPAALPVAIPLMVLASILTHLTAKHSVDRQNPASATQQTAMMNKLTLYVFPIGLLAFGAFLPLGLLIYFLANNAWTLMQQRVVYRRIDAEEEAKKAAVVEKRTTLAPKPGQKPKAKKRPAEGSTQPKQGQAKPGQAKPGQAKSGQAKSGQAKSTGKQGQGKQGAKPAAKAGASGDGAAENGKNKPKAEPPGGKNSKGSKNSKTTDGTSNSDEVPGMISDATSKKSGRKRR